MTPYEAGALLSNELKRAEAVMREFKHDAAFAIMSSALVDASAAGVSLNSEHHAVMARINGFIRECWPSHFNMAREHKFAFGSAVQLVDNEYTKDKLYVISDNARSGTFAPVYRLSRTNPALDKSFLYPARDDLGRDFDENDLAAFNE